MRLESELRRDSDTPYRVGVCGCVYVVIVCVCGCVYVVIVCVCGCVYVVIVCVCGCVYVVTVCVYGRHSIYQINNRLYIHALC